MSITDRNYPNGRTLEGGKQGVQATDSSSALGERFPEVLVDEILAKLPFSSLVRFCIVCKRWRDLVVSSKTFPRCTSRRNRLLVFREGENGLNIFSSSRGTWEIISLQFLRKHFAIRDVVASSSGLLCFDSSIDGEFVVCNPVTKHYKKLQMPDCMLPFKSGNFLWSCIAGMVVDSHTGHFKLVVANFDPIPGNLTVVYNSITDTWKKIASIPEEIFYKFHYMFKELQATDCHGNLLFYVKKSFEGEALFEFEIEHEAWRWISAPGYEGHSYNNNELLNGFSKRRMRDHFLLECREFIGPEPTSTAGRERLQNVETNFDLISNREPMFGSSGTPYLGYDCSWLFTPSTLLLE